jgi:hypothetical protein
MIIDVPSGTTKAELLTLLQEKAQEWIEAHYESDPEDRASIRITIDSISGV